MALTGSLWRGRRPWLMRGVSGCIQTACTKSTPHTAMKSRAATSELKDRKWSPISPIQTAVCNVDRREARCLAEEGWGRRTPPPRGRRGLSLPRHVFKNGQVMVRCGTSCGHTGSIDQRAWSSKRDLSFPRSFFFFFLFWKLRHLSRRSNYFP